MTVTRPATIGENAVPTAGEAFYASLPAFTRFDASMQPAHYRPLPDDWLVVVSDVQGSTAAIEDGRYKDVNALGVASIVAVLNAIRPLAIPYVFGGDGATFAVPATRREAVTRALVAARDLARSAFDLRLRVGLVPMARIRADGHQILVACYQPSAHYRQAMFLGDGLGHAERLIKDPRPDHPFLVRDDGSIPAEGDFTGFECRWNEIASPHEEIISLLVQARSADLARQEAVYGEVLREIQAIYGDDATCHPLRPDLLTLSSSPRTLSTEVAVFSDAKGRRRRGYAWKLRLLTWLGRILMRRGLRLAGADWGTYKQRLIANTDHRKIDEVLRMVIAGTADQRQRLRAYLSARQGAGDLVFGIHAAATALMTCVISDYDQGHVHFLDASHGGYALAAREMKRQMKA